VAALYPARNAGCLEKVGQNGKMPRGFAAVMSALGSSTYLFASWLFTRALGLIYFAAFASLAAQIRGLLGRQGILPARELLQQTAYSGPRRFLRRPTLCWINADDRFLLFLAWSGALLGILLALGTLSTPLLLFLWVLYLSLFNVGQIFLGFQWDILLLEAGFLAVFLHAPGITTEAPSMPPRLALWLLWWLLFRLMFSSGVVKIRGSDRSWLKLTALRYHYQTQPLPTPLSWYAHKAPLRFHQLSAAFMFAIELVAPLLIFGPARYRHFAALLFALLMVLIQLTGNYGFFNLLGLALSVLLLDDQFLLQAFHRLFPMHSFPLQASSTPALQNWLVAPAALIVAILSIDTMARLFRVEMNWPKVLADFFRVLAPFRLVNSYGLFAVMTLERPELIIEGSNDAVTWQEYEFKWKPGNLKCAPQFISPHQPRLDWQMWFAALSYYENHPWFTRFLFRLLDGSPSVLALMESNPFPRTPPRYVRAVMYDYRFTSVFEARQRGAWWQRERRGVYCPTLSLLD
jgi:hypothetical protein